MFSATQVITSYRFNNGHGSPKWTNFGCFGNESSLTNCPYDIGVCEAYNTITATFSIVGLKCEGELTGILYYIYLPLLNYIIGSCTNGAVRLNGGPNSAEGIIEICSNGAWGTVSNDEFGNKDALVACRQLGYASPSKYQIDIKCHHCIDRC